MSNSAFARVHRSWIDSPPTTVYAGAGPADKVVWAAKAAKDAVAEGLVPAVGLVRFDTTLTENPAEKVCEGGYQVREGGKLTLVIEW